MTEQTEKEILNLLKKQQEMLKKQGEELSNQREKIDYISAELKNQKEKLDYVSNDLRNFSRHFAVFEYDFSLKVDALFEKYGSDFDEHKVFKKDINSLKDDSFKHGVQIEHLSKRIVNA